MSRIEVEVRVRVYDNNGRPVAEASRTEGEPLDSRGLEFWLNRATSSATARVRDSLEQLVGDVAR